MNQEHNLGYYYYYYYYTHLPKKDQFPRILYSVRKYRATMRA